MKISIITPNYNYDEYIGETIRSVVEQDYEEIEHIIVDDGSTDNSVQIIKSYQKLYPNKIRLIEQENRGQTSAINTGMRLVTGEIIGWLNSDDTYKSDTFKVIEVGFNEYAADIIYGDIDIINREGEFLYTKKQFGFNYLENCFVGFTNTIASNSFFFKRNLLNKVGMLDESMKCNMDGEFFSRITRDAKVIHIHVVLANFRKQLRSKAAQDKISWEKIVKRESEYERRKSYSKLFISNIIPYKFGKYLKYLFFLRRFVIRLFRGDYIKKYSKYL